MAELRHLAVVCLNHCLEQLRVLPSDAVSTESLHAPESLVGTYEIDVVPLSGLDSEGMVRVTVRTHTTRGHEIVVSAVCAPGAYRDAS